MQKNTIIILLCLFCSLTISAQEKTNFIFINQKKPIFNENIISIAKRSDSIGIDYLTRHSPQFLYTKMDTVLRLPTYRLEPIKFVDLPFPYDWRTAYRYRFIYFFKIK